MYIEAISFFIFFYKTMLSLWYILILNIYAINFTQCVSLKKQHQKKENLRIIGGRDALPGEYPYILGIVVEVITPISTVNMNLCTCACIKPTWSLTAAHCIHEMIFLNDSGVAKIKIQYKPEYTAVAFVNVLSMAVTPNFEGTREAFLSHNDLGILKTEKIDLSSYARVSSVDYSTLYGLKVTTVGYGLMLDDHGSFNDTDILNKPLQVVGAMIVKCGINLSPHYCLAGTCSNWTPLGPGDSGGPVIHYSGIVGVNKASLFEHFRKRISIQDYKLKLIIAAITPVSPFMDWIINVIN